MAQLVRVQNFSVSRDGFGAGENQSFERPFGHADPGDMFAWSGATRSWPNRTDPGGSRGLDDYFTRDFANNIGAEIVGRNNLRPTTRPMARPRMAGLVGQRTTVSHCGIRHDAPRAPVVHPV